MLIQAVDFDIPGAGGLDTPVVANSEIWLQVVCTWKFDNQCNMYVYVGVLWNYFKLQSH